MLYDWIISLPMMLCFFWCIFFAVRFHHGSAEPRVMGTIYLFYIAATILYTDHWLYFSGHPSFLGEWSYLVVNLCVYPYILCIPARSHAHEDIFRGAVFAPARSFGDCHFPAERVFPVGA